MEIIQLDVKKLKTLLHNSENASQIKKKKISAVVYKKEIRILNELKQSHGLKNDAEALRLAISKAGEK